MYRPIVVIAAILCWGCTTPPPPLIDAGYEGKLAARGFAPGSIADPSVVANVTVISGDLAADKKARLDAHDGLDILRRAFFAELEKGNHLDADSAYSLAVQVTTFRLRSTAANFWLGIMVGNDSIAVEVQLLKSAEVVRTIKTNASSIKGGVYWPSSAGRLNNLANVVAERAVSDLFRERSESD